MDGTSLQVMAVLDPLLVELSGLPATGRTLTIPDFPFDPSRGSHTLQIEDSVYIDRSDFRLVDEEVGNGWRLVMMGFFVSVLEGRHQRCCHVAVITSIILKLPSLSCCACR